METHAKIRPINATVAPAGSAAGGDFNQSRASQEADRAARYKLVIEQGARKGVFIYKVLDRETGEVVRQLPQLMSMSKTVTDLVETKAEFY